jgi:tryptophan synthase alpha subunit
MGVTGNKTNLDDAGIRYLTMIKEVSGKYVAGGFGIRTREQVVALCEHADCAIIGSALLKEITSAVEEKSDPIAVAERFLDRILF